MGRIERKRKRVLDSVWREKGEEEGFSRDKEEEGKGKKAEDGK